ncbi:protein PIN-LIKES 3-like [Prosopis cineraria]|uniref:protein PIN-LIKES 3-like n=1 Tax=Prosopis cineraria TaxID=364024 RepID=UPI00240EF2D6|nr:protein PIN-LIKES 3-like [Prosopis cineraria]
MEFGDLFVIALMPVIKVLLLIAIGTILALDRFDILGENARKYLNNMAYFVFTPALTLCNMAHSANLKSSLLMLWFLPLNILLTFIIGSALGWLLIKITRPPRHLHGLVVACCAAGNLGNIPFIIIPAVCKERSKLFGDKDVCNRDAMTYASLSLAIGSIFIWTYVYNLVRRYSCQNSTLSQVDVSQMNRVFVPITNPENSSTSSIGLPITMNNILQTNDQDNAVEIGITRPKGVGNSLQVTKLAKIMNLLKMLAEKVNLKALIAPATIGTVIGTIIGTMSGFQNILVGENAPLHVIDDTVSMLSDAAIPILSLLVGAYIVKGVIVVRYIALPAFGVGVLKGAICIGMIHPDPLYKFALLLHYALPPAININTMCQIFGIGVDECSILMLATNVCALAAITLWCTFFMWLIL